jgi:hypothetical protein
MSSIKSKYVLLALSVLNLVVLASANLRRESILDQQIFSLDVKCSIPMLGLSVAEIQVDKSGRVVALADIQKNFDLHGIENNEKTNPNKIKSINMVMLVESGKVGVFWTNLNDEVFVTRPVRQLDQLLGPCGIWLKEMITLSDDFKSAQPAELVKDESKFGNNKLAFDDDMRKVRYEYIFQDDNLSALTQIRKDASLLSNLIAFVNSSKVLNEKEFVAIPDGIQYEDN